MMKGILTLFTALFLLQFTQAQVFEKKWVLQEIEGDSLFQSYAYNKDFLKLEQNSFEYSFKNALDNLKGDYLKQNNSLIFF